MRFIFTKNSGSENEIISLPVIIFRILLQAPYLKPCAPCRAAFGLCPPGTGRQRQPDTPQAVSTSNTECCLINMVDRIMETQSVKEPLRSILLSASF